jgi:hypothetical protein
MGVESAPFEWSFTDQTVYQIIDKGPTISYIIKNPGLSVFQGLGCFIDLK